MMMMMMMSMISC